MNGTIRTGTTLISLGLALCTLTGCISAGTASDDPSTTTVTCNGTPDLSKKPPTVAILGQNGSAAAKYYADDLNKVISGSESVKARVIVNGIGTNADAPSLLTNLLLVPEGENDTVRQEDLTCKEKLIHDAFSSTLAKQPDPRPLDVFSAIYTLSGNLVGTPVGTQVNLVLLSSLLNSSGIGDLTKLAVLTNITGTLNMIAAAKLKPDCTGWRVYAIGASSNNVAQDAQLREFWRRYFEWCGGSLITWTSHLSQFPVSSGAIQPADTTQIPIHRDPVKITAVLNGDVTFDDGQADLRPAAEDELKQLLPLTVEGKGRIQIDGYTDIDTGEGPAWLQDLSTRRADAVQGWLIAHGVAASRINPRGHGASSPVYADPKTSAQHQANRRVVVTIYIR